MGQRAAAQPSEAENQQLAIRHPPMLGREFLHRRLRCKLHRRFGGARQGAGDIERVGQPFDQLDAEREADFPVMIRIASSSAS